MEESSDKIYSEGWIPGTRFDLDRWMKTLPQPWSAALEATMFSVWIYDHFDRFQFLLDTNPSVESQTGSCSSP